MQPRKWKMWLLLSIGAYPVIFTLLLLTSSILEKLPMYASLAVVTVLMTGSMTYLVIPLMNRLFGDWLRK